MGLDGGTIISRNDVLRGASWELNKADNSRSSRGGAVRGTFKRKRLDAQTSKVTQWTTCAISGQPLVAPVVACFLGRLMSRQCVLEFLLGRAGHFADDADLTRHLNILREHGADAFAHIQSIKDVFPLQYAPAEAGAVTTAADGSADPQLPPPYCCPVTHLRCDRHPFVALRPCGHVLAERAVREVAQDGTCPICSKPFEEEDAVPLLPTEEQEARLRELLPGRRKQRRGKKEGCKGKGGAAATANDGEEEQQQQQSDGGQQQQPVRGEQQDVKRQRHERQETAGGAAQAGA